MDGLSWPVALYDIIGIIVPGTLLLGALGLVIPEARQFFYINGWVVLIVGYVVGHLVQAAAKCLLAPVEKLWRPPAFLQSVSENLRLQIYSELERFYGPGLARKGIETYAKDLAYSVVWDRMDNYKLFIALSDVTRAVALVFSLAAVELTLSLSSIVCAPLPQALEWAGLAVSIVAVPALIDRSRFFRRLADGVVYHSFLAAVREKRSVGR